MNTKQPLRVLQLSLDETLLDPGSESHVRILRHGEQLDWCGVVIPTSKKRAYADASVHIQGTGGRSRVTRWLRMLWISHRMIRQNKATIVSAQDMYFLALLAVILQKINNIAITVQVHSLDRFTFFRKELSDFVLNYVHSLLVASDALKHKVVESFGISEEKVHIVPTFVDLESWRNRQFTLNRFSHWEDDFVFLCVSRLVPVKRVHGIITAFEGVVRQFPRCRLVIVGTGRQAAKLRRQVKELDIVESVEFIEHTDAIVDYYRHSNCFVSFSQFEGYGKPLVEALSCQLPVITTPVGIAATIVRDGVNGLFVRPNDLESLMTLMKLVVVNEAMMTDFKNNARDFLKLLPTEQQTHDLHEHSWRAALNKV